ncbi:ornithine cyclodeaminase family protein [Methyloraptor flagellatus]|uniref:Ornithine cyclodeaminase family protein n=1 Tax=Methyloraptor flagellatus TaxID=3162530 RepID=A0AAU7XF06_9HYPH
MIALDCDILGPQLGLDALVAALDKDHRNGVDRVERALLTEPRADEPGGPNHLLVWPAWRFGAYAGAKLVSVFPGNAAVGRPTNATVYVLFDGADGRPLAVLTGDCFTMMKTAADSALAARYLARPDARVLACLGAGAQAATQIAALRAVRPSIERIVVWNRTAEKVERLVARLREDGLDAVVAVDADTAVGAADIVTAVTSSTVPIVLGARLRPGTHVDLVGGFTPAMREADDDAVRHARVFVDTRQFTVKDCGDIAGPIASGALRPEDIVGDLYDLCRGWAPGRRADDEITLFKNAGGGHLDLMTAVAFYRFATGTDESGGA